jgi:hypothetical protein
VLFSESAPPGSELPHPAERGDPKARRVIGLEARLRGSFSRAPSLGLVQLGQSLEGFK